MEDLTFIAKLAKYSSLLLVIITLVVLVNVQMHNNVPPNFIETADKFDGSKWVYEENPPTVTNGSWAFQFPALTKKLINVHTVAMFTYGRYQITFRTSGPREPGVNYYVFLYNDQRASGGAYNELDIPELFGSEGSYQMSISTYRDVSTSNSYRYWQSTINFEDGATHTWSFNYQPTRIDFYVDGQLSYTWIDKSTAPIFAKPPMLFYVGGNSEGNNTSAWTWYVSQIEYIPS